MRKLAALLFILSAPLQRPSSPAARFQLVEATIDDVRDALASKQITCRALVEQYFARINAYDKSGPSLNTVQTINPRALQDADRLDTALASSGSSGGTGSGVAANFATVGIGEDTGGSVRGPASVNNLVGLRPTLPLVSRFGMMPARPTTDTLGPIARSVKDAAIVLDAIAGYDANDPVTADAVGHVPSSYTQFLVADGLKGARIGVIREPLDSRADP